MSPPRPAEVLLGDAVRVLARLRPSPEETGRVLALLGLSVTPDRPRPPTPTPRPASRPLVQPPAPVTPARAPAVRDVMSLRPPDGPGESPAPLVEHSPADPGRRAAAPRRLPDLTEVLNEPPDAAHAVVPDPGATALLPPDRQRAILTAVCRGPAETGEPDIDAVVDRIGRGEPLRELPLRTVPTTRRGVQVLVDYGTGMRPFTRDQADVVGALRRLAGPDGFQVLRFAGCPLNGAGTGPAWTWRPYRPPLAGQPVVVLSDVGAGLPAPERWPLQRAWLDFSALLRAAGNQVVVLAPVPVNRFPARLRAALPILTWDRTTSVADAVGHLTGRRRR